MLVEGDGVGDPIGEEVQSLTDGHIWLSSRLAQAGHYPAIDVLASNSRLMPEVSSERHRAVANRARALLAKYKELEVLLQVGEYRKGADPHADAAVERHVVGHNFMPVHQAVVLLLEARLRV